MGFDELMAIAQSEFVFAILFIGLLYLSVKQVQKALETNRAQSADREQYIMDMHHKQMVELKENMLHERGNMNEIIQEQRHSFNKRETELLKHLEKNTAQLSNITGTLKDIQRNLSKLEERVEDNFMDVWKELGSKQYRNKE